MLVERRLYTGKEVGQIIKDVVKDIAVKLANSPSADKVEQETIMRQWALELLPVVEDAVAEEVIRRHVQGVTLSVWIGPPGSGKGTNIDTVNMLGKVYAEVTSQGVARVLEEPFNTMLLKFSVEETVINTGTKGMFNRPEGEYLELFGELVPIVGKLVSDGGFVPDDMVSVLVELMLLYRLTQNFHKIQIDLWPRTGPQFTAFSSLVKKIEEGKGKISREIVTIKVLKKQALQFVKENLPACAEKSIIIAERIKTVLKGPEYKETYEKTSAILDPKLRFAEEKKVLNQVFEQLKKEFLDEMSHVVVDELEVVCERMSFRFNLVLSQGQTPRPDEYPLSIIRRLSIYTGETSPVFLKMMASNIGKSGFYVVSSAGTPEEVIAEILETLAGKEGGDSRWQAIKKLAGEIAIDYVYRKELIVDTLVQRVGGILSS